MRQRKSITMPVASTHNELVIERAAKRSKAFHEIPKEPLTAWLFNGESFERIPFIQYFTYREAGYDVVKF